MDFHQLRYFLEVARQEHMGRAADVLAISQSALSHAIATLEASLGVKLFIRENRRIFLSNSGRLLLEGGEKLLREKLKLEEEIRSQIGEMHGTVRIASPVAINAHFVGPAWASLSATHPKLKAEIISRRTLEIIPKVISGEIDLGICYGPQAHPLLNESLLARRKLVAVTKAGRLSLKGKTLQSIAQSLSTLSVSLPKGLLGFGYGDTHPFFERHGIKPNVSLLYDNYEVAVENVLQNSTWCLLPDWIVERSAKIQAVRPAEIFEPLPITSITPKTRPLSKAVELMMSNLKATIKAP